MSDLLGMRKDAVIISWIKLIDKLAVRATKSRQKVSYDNFVLDIHFLVFTSLYSFVHMWQISIVSFVDTVYKRISGRLFWGIHLVFVVLCQIKCSISGFKYHCLAILGFYPIRSATLPTCSTPSDINIKNWTFEQVFLDRRACSI